MGKAAGATAAHRLGGGAVIDDFTELRWITIEDPEHDPFRRREQMHET